MTQPQYIHELLARSAQHHPAKPALICPNRTLTWAELAAEVDRFEPWFLEHLSSKSQQPVGLLLSNSWELVAAYLAILRAGHIAVPLDPSLKPLELAAICSQMDLAWVVTSGPSAASLPAGTRPVTPAQLARGLGGAKAVAAALARLSGRRIQLPPDEQLATLLFTSGTTGKPKAVPYTHANYLWNVAAVSELWRWTEADTQLMNLPLSHWHGLAMGIGGALYHANTVYLPERFDADATLETLATGKISLFMHVPNAYAKLVAHRPERTYELGGVRLFVSGSSYLPPAIWQRFRDRFGHEILERYGSSETGLVASNTLTERTPGSVGYLLPGVEVQVQPDGELALKSPGVFPGYYRNPTATAAKIISGGWWLSGDIGAFTGRRLALKGRIQEKIKKHSYTLYPRDLEWALQQHPAVAEVIVIGLQSPESLNDRIAYFVVGDIDEAEVVAYCRQHLPAAWRPDVIQILDELPRGRSGKPAMALLRQRAQSGPAEAQ